MEDKINEVLLVLDKFLGDTDPHIEEDWTDEDIKDEEPIFWVFQKLTEIEEQLKNHKREVK